VTERPCCKCHGEPMYRNGVRSAWRCAIKARERNSRRIRMRCGYDLQFFVGYAPTAEAAEYLRRKIHDEAPRYA
jgi:hypothetical protein